MQASLAVQGRLAGPDEVQQPGRQVATARRRSSGAARGRRRAVRRPDPDQRHRAADRVDPQRRRDHELRPAAAREHAASCARSSPPAVRCRRRASTAGRPRPPTRRGETGRASRPTTAATDLRLGTRLRRRRRARDSPTSEHRCSNRSARRSLAGPACSLGPVVRRAYTRARVIDAATAGQGIRRSRRRPGDAAGPGGNDLARRRHRRALPLRSRVALVGGHGPAARHHLVPDAAPRLRDVGRDARRHGRRPGARHRSRRGLRHPARTRQVGRRRRAVGHDRMGGSGRDARRPSTTRRGASRDRRVHRHRRLDGVAFASSATVRGATCSRPQRAHARTAQRVPRPGGEDDRRRPAGRLRQPDASRPVCRHDGRRGRAMGVQIRVGVHTGEVELVGDDVRG